jgi:hypothetical protein
VGSPFGETTVATRQQERASAERACRRKGRARRLAAVRAERRQIELAIGTENWPLLHEDGPTRDRFFELYQRHFDLSCQETDLLVAQKRDR